MEKIKKFLFVELENLKAEKEENLRNIYRGELNIESIDKAIAALELELDSTGDVFKPAEGEESNIEKEIRSLRGRKESIQEDIDVIRKRLIVNDNKMNLLDDLQKGEGSVDISGYKMLSIRENERQRIARDMHDTVVQKITALIHKTEFVQQVMDNDMPRAKLELEVINKAMHECVDELRNLIYDLRPMSIDDIGFKDTISRSINEFSSNTDMNISLNMDNLNEDKIDSIIQISVFRIIHELTTNSIKHSNGQNIKIEIYNDDNRLIIKHIDDGKGYVSQNSVTSEISNGFGLAIVKERVKLLNGNIQCEHGNGTINIISIPCLSINAMEA